MTKDNYEMALSVLNDLEINQNTPHIIAGIAYAKAAVRKQIPKKPTHIIDDDYAECPACGNANFEFGINDWGCKYCPDCGQALDWSEN